MYFFLSALWSPEAAGQILLCRQGKGYSQGRANLNLGSGAINAVIFYGDSLTCINMYCCVVRFVASCLGSIRLLLQAPGSLNCGMSQNMIYPLHATFFRGNQNIYLCFMSFLHIDMTQVAEIFPHIRQWLTCSAETISWLLMIWRHEPGS